MHGLPIAPSPYDRAQKRLIGRQIVTQNGFVEVNAHVLRENSTWRTKLFTRGGLRFLKHLPR